MMAVHGCRYDIASTLMGAFLLPYTVSTNVTKFFITDFVALGERLRFDFALLVFHSLFSPRFEI
jgi:hypothetical protein